MRFSLRQFLIGICFIGIVLSLLQSDGCGRRLCTISGLSFSGDGKLLAVARLDARDARTPMKGYWENVCRTVSLLDVASGGTRDILEQDLRRGNQGPAFHLLHPMTSLVFTQSSGRLYVPELGGGRISIYDLRSGTKPRELSSPHPALNLAIRQDECVLAAGGFDGTVIWDLPKEQPLLTLPIADMAFVGAPVLHFSAANDSLIAAGNNGIEEWDVNNGTLVRSIDAISESRSWMSLSPSGRQLIVSRSHAWDLYDLESKSPPQSKETAGRITFACFSPNGKEIAISSEDTVSIVDAGTRERVQTLRAGDWVSIIAISRGGDKLAVGTVDGCVTVWDANTGTRLWRLEAPGRVRLPWTVPAAVGAILLIVCWKFRRFGVKQARTIAKTDEEQNAE